MRECLLHPSPPSTGLDEGRAFSGLRQHLASRLTPCSALNGYGTRFLRIKRSPCWPPSRMLLYPCRCGSLSLELLLAGLAPLRALQRHGGAPFLVTLSLFFSHALLNGTPTNRVDGCRIVPNGWVSVCHRLEECSQELDVLFGVCRPGVCVGYFEDGVGKACLTQRATASCVFLPRFLGKA